MTDKSWTIESVAFTPAEEAFIEDAFRGTLGELEGTMVGRAIGSMDDGRRFSTFTIITREIWDDKGEEWCADFVREAAHPPEDTE